MAKVNELHQKWTLKSITSRMDFGGATPETMLYPLAVNTYVPGRDFLFLVFLFLLILMAVNEAWGSKGRWGLSGTVW
jgi:hypothetical protein